MKSLKLSIAALGTLVIATTASAPAQASFYSYQGGSDSISSNYASYSTNSRFSSRTGVNNRRGGPGRNPGRFGGGNFGGSNFLFNDLISGNFNASNFANSGLFGPGFNTNELLTILAGLNTLLNDLNTLLGGSGLGGSLTGNPTTTPGGGTIVTVGNTSGGQVPTPLPALLILTGLVGLAAQKRRDNA